MIAKESSPVLTGISLMYFADVSLNGTLN
jgi:hypothetical protein